MPNEKQIGKWVISETNLGGVYFIGPKGRILFLAPYASESEKLAVLNALPNYVKAFYENNLENIDVEN